MQSYILKDIFHLLLKLWKISLWLKTGGPPFQPQIAEKKWSDKYSFYCVKTSYNLMDILSLCLPTISASASSESPVWIVQGTGSLTMNENHEKETEGLGREEERRQMWLDKWRGNRLSGHVNSGQLSWYCIPEEKKEISYQPQNSITESVEHIGVTSRHAGISEQADWSHENMKHHLRGGIQYKMQGNLRRIS